MSTGPEVCTARLSNGLRLVSQEMPTLETAALGVWVNTGGRHESAALNGASHLLEHMAFKGTERRDAYAIATEIEAVGGHLNAYTSREQTAYYAKVLKEDQALAMDLLGDILCHSQLADDELAREKDVVIQEIGQAHDTPDDIVFDNFQEVAYPGQAIGRPVLGSADGVAALGREDLFGYLGERYTAADMVLAVAGNIDHDKLLDWAGEAFGGIAPGPGPGCERARYVGGEFRGRRDLEQLHMVLGIDGIAYNDNDFYALQVLSTLLGGGMSSRLFQEVREKRGLAYSVFTFAASYVDGGLFGVYAGSGGEEGRELLEVVCDELRKACDGIREDEVARARAQLKSGLLMALESCYSRCEQLARQTLIYGRVKSVAETVAAVDAVDAAAVEACMWRLLNGAAPTFAALGPVAELPALETLAARLA